MLAGAVECFGSDATGVVSQVPNSTITAWNWGGCGGGFQQLAASETFVCGVTCGAIYCWGTLDDPYGVVPYATRTFSPVWNTQAAEFVGPITGVAFATAPVGSRTDGDYWASQWCDAGHFAGRGSMQTCYACPVGQYQPMDNSGYCLVCGAGTYTDTTASIACATCAAPAGYQCLEESKTATGSVCPAGFFCAGAAATAEQCSSPPGSYCPAGSESAVGVCVAACLWFRVFLRFVFVFVCPCVL